MQQLITDVEKLWTSNQTFEKTISGWINDINKNMPEVQKARKAFHEWKPLKVYTSVTKLKKATPSFSVRLLGQEVAEIRVLKHGAVKLYITEKPINHVASNKKYFGLTFNKDDFPVDWDSKEAKDFRNTFKFLQKKTTHSPEHQIETKIIEAMKNPPTKRGMPGIQPVLIVGCPLQVPLPVKACNGKPEPSNRGGNIDILARRGRGRGTRLSVWELKKPGLSTQALIKAIKQNLIYASSLVMMLRSSSGNAWYNLFEFGGSVPKELKVESVLTIALSDKTIFSNAISMFKQRPPLSIKNDSIIPYVAYYDDRTYKVVSINQIT
ncbi:MAG: hypothetical protein AB1724_10900 [Thermodesulfobacteriota bacterium]